MTPFEFSCAMKGNDKVVKNEWEMVRTQCYYMMLPYQKKGKEYNFKDVIMPIDEIKKEEIVIAKITVNKDWKPDE
jgi:hypothetical protein